MKIEVSYMFCKTKPGSDEFVDVRMFTRKIEYSVYHRECKRQMNSLGYEWPRPFKIDLIDLDRFRPI